MTVLIEPPIRFHRKEEILNRKNYRPQLTVDQSGLSHIVGVYNFDEQDAFYCGLNGCKKKHWNGVVFSTKEGLESHCGNICGANAFPEDFAEKERLFRNALARIEQEVTINELIENAEAHLAKASSLADSIDKHYSNLQKIRTALRVPRELDRHIENIFRANGKIKLYKEIQQPSFRPSARQRIQYTEEVIGEIAGVIALRDYAKASREVNEINSTFFMLMSRDPATFTKREIKAFIAFNNDLSHRIAALEAFVAACEAFFCEENIEQIERINMLGGVKPYQLRKATNILKSRLNIPLT